MAAARAQRDDAEHHLAEAAACTADIVGLQPELQRLERLCGLRPAEVWDPAPGMEGFDGADLQVRGAGGRALKGHCRCAVDGCAGCLRCVLPSC